MSDDNNIKLIENFKICTYKVVYDDNKLDEIISELKEKYFELKSEIIYSFHGIETIPNIFNQNLSEAIDLLHVEEDLYNIESEYSVGLYGKKYNIAYKKYSLLYYLVNKKSSSIESKQKNTTQKTSNMEKNTKKSASVKASSKKTAESVSKNMSKTKK